MTGVGCTMSMVGAYFVGFVTPTSKDSGQYWNDEIREAIRNGFNREVMDDIGFTAAKAEHDANVVHTLALIQRRAKVIASVKEAKARSQAAVEAMSDVIDSASRIAKLGMMDIYSYSFQSMGLVPNDEDVSIFHAQQEYDDKMLKMNEMRVTHMKAHCQDGLDRRFGENNAKLVGQDYYVLRVRSEKGWVTCTRLPKLPLFDWRQRIKDADVAEEVRRIMRC
jgi:hypothetical protein